MTRQQQFWKWFTEHEAELFDFDPEKEVEREELFNRLTAQLQKIDKDLSFEFGPCEPVREFVISASGIRRAFPAVISLTDAAPKLSRWKIIAFRPRRTPINAVNFQGEQVDPKDIQFTLLDNEKMLSLYLFIPRFRKGNIAMKSIGYLMLDEALGEYDVETRLGLIEMFSPDTDIGGERFQLSDLPALFDRLIAQMERRSGKPS